MVKDTLKNETMEFKSINKACEYLGAKRHNINEAIAAKRLFRKRYKIEYKVEIEKHE
ncbi:NUMOD1 domain-containing DNA-binding protein [Paraclostridium sordellii]|uniref:NUMOD1 domain-containing DNA-binding protein n=1 Tax=Paraclostridium sordellii TaxID=1505 RepID=UPI002ED6B80C